MSHPPASVLRRGFRLIGRYVRLHPGPFLAALSGAVLFSGALVAGTVVLGRVTDELIIPAFEEGDTEVGVVVAAAAAIIGLSVLRAVGVVVRRYFAAMVANRSQVSLRRSVIDTYLAVPLSFHQTTPTGELLAHADADVEAATEVLNPLPFTTGVISLIVFSIVSLALVDPMLMLVGVAVFPILTVINRVYTARVEEPASMVQEHVGRVSNVAHESFDGALVVKTLGREAHEVDRMRRASDGLRDSRIEVGRLRATFEPTIDLIPNVGTVVLLLVGSWRLSDGAVTTGELVQAMALFGVLAFPMRVVGFFLEEMPRSVVSLERIDRVLAEPPAPSPSPDAALRLPDGPLALEVRDVGYAYGDAAPVLDGVSFDAAPGEIVALVGPTGAGKSTLCQLLVRLSDPDRGHIRLGGVDLAHVRPDELRRAAALVFQESFLFADTVGDNIGLDTGASPAEVLAAARIARADRFIAELPHGFDTPMGERGVTLSGGQRQRVALARALVRQPRLLLLDDATSAVDALIEAEILDGLRRALDTTTVIVAHRVSTIELADRVVYLHAGRVVAQGTHAELLALPAYEALVRAYEEEAIG
ncbi:MAG TPA: ABC transporter ATP-binding protein [Acidimicrobiales bacterium]|nr:ABC transporter ATP-binding protein [Acidimicrobiales bacterium]